MRILVVGGAGYIGSHTVRECRRRGIDVVVFDDLSEGHRQAVGDTPLVVGSLHDPATLEATLSDGGFDAVFHFAALCSVPESVREPLAYYHRNVAGTLELVRAMVATGVERLIFSSTAAVYGEPHGVPIREDHPRAPVNPYGRSKLLVEELLAEIAGSHPLRFVALRYFNAAGADPDGGIGEDHREESHLIPRVLLTALGQYEDVKIFGSDYDTADGSCVRDFVHVNDIARAHLLALERIDELDGPEECAINLGSAEISVQQVVDSCRRITGIDFPVVAAGRRPGDPAILIASQDRARQVLGWQPELSDLETIIGSAWEWHRDHPRGFGDTALSGPGSATA